MNGVRIAVTGSAGTGKTTLASAVADRLGLPLVRDDARACVERTGRPLSTLAPDEGRTVLRELWRSRIEAERAHPAGFVADGCSVELAAHALHHGCARAGDPDWEALLAQTRAHARSYHAILVLPWGGIPRQRGGAGAPDPSLELRYQLVLEGLLRASARPSTLHLLPPAESAARGRMEWAVAISTRAAGRGCVHLVGAGPGDPGLLTLRARELLAACDVVAHDELVPPAILELADANAERLAVGRRCHGAKRAPMRLHPDVLARARAGKVVVRLKAGDPFIFGRGGEEAEELAEAGIPFEVVPGISAALGAAASARIPLTHRTLSSDVTFATGHDLTHTAMPERSDWRNIAQSGTLVLYMAAQSLSANLDRLVRNGRPATTPAAWIAAATRPEQQVVVGSLADLAARVGERPGDAPALVIVGEVVRVRERLLALAAARRMP